MNYKFYAKKPNGEPVRINVIDNLASGCWDVLINGELIEELSQYCLLRVNIDHPMREAIFHIVNIHNPRDEIRNFLLTSSVAKAFEFTDISISLT